MTQISVKQIRPHLMFIEEAQEDKGRGTGLSVFIINERFVIRDLNNLKRKL